MNIYIVSFMTNNVKRSNAILTLQLAWIRLLEKIFSLRAAFIIGQERRLERRYRGMKGQKKLNRSPEFSFTFTIITLPLSLFTFIENIIWLFLCLFVFLDVDEEYFDLFHALSFVFHSPFHLIMLHFKQIFVLLKLNKFYL